MKRKKIGLINIWPGFVDSISTLLLVFVFLLVVLMISENFLTQSLTGKNNALDNLRIKLQSLELDIKYSSEKNKELSNLLLQLNEELDNLNIKKLNAEQNLKEENIKNKNLTLNITDLENKIFSLADQLGLEKLKTTKQQNLNNDLRLTIENLNENIILLNNELLQVRENLKQSNKNIEEKNLEISDLGSKLNKP